MAELKPNNKTQTKKEEKPTEKEEEFMFDEPDDTLEEFDEIGGNDITHDPEVTNWDEHWDTTGWDDEDPNDDFIKNLKSELTKYQALHSLGKQQE